MPKDALGHGSNKRGAHSAGIAKAVPRLSFKNKWVVAHEAGPTPHRTRIDAVNHYEDLRHGAHPVTITDPRGNVIYHSYGRGG